MTAAPPRDAVTRPDRPLDFGYESRVVRTRWFSRRVDRRVVLVSAALFVVAVICALITMTLGDYRISLDRVVGTLLGGGTERQHLVVVRWRLPIALAAVLFGALLGIGGAIFQSLTRNPLGSPDIIGFSTGAYTAVVITMLVFGTAGYWPIAGAALGGGLATALLVYALAYRRGIQGFRLIIVGIGVSAVLGSINAYLITRAEVEDAMSVGFWGAGSLHRITWNGMGPTVGVAALVVLAVVLLSRDLRRLELGDDAAVTHGVRPNRARLALLVTGVATVALVTAVAGPIGFIALVAPQVAKRLTRSPGVSLLASAAMGAVLLTCAQMLALVVADLHRRIPVGLITVCLGGLYLIWLLIREARVHYGGPR